MVKISDLFEIQKGSCSGIEDYQTGSVPLVSATASRNGVVGFIARQVDVNGKDTERFFANVPCLSVAVVGEGGLMFAAVQHGEFHATHHTEVLIPKMEHFFWASDFDKRLITMASVIRANRWRFHYGRNAGGRLGDLEIDDQQIAAVAACMNITTPKQATITLATVQGIINKIQQTYGQSPCIADVFSIKSMCGVAAEGLKESGKFPVVGADGNITNGVIGFADSLPSNPFPQDTLSVAKNGSNAGVCRVHRIEWGATSDVACLMPKASWTADELLVLAALVQNQEWRFFYGRKASVDRLKDQSLFL